MSATVNAFTGITNDSSSSLPTTRLYLYWHHKRTLRQPKNKTNTGKIIEFCSFLVCFDFPSFCIYQRTGIYLCRRGDVLCVEQIWAGRDGIRYMQRLLTKWSQPPGLLARLLSYIRAHRGDTCSLFEVMPLWDCFPHLTLAEHSCI